MKEQHNISGIFNHEAIAIYVIRPLMTPHQGCHKEMVVVYFCSFSTHASSSLSALTSFLTYGFSMFRATTPHSATKRSDEKTDLAYPSGPVTVQLTLPPIALNMAKLIPTTNPEQ